LLVRAFVDAEGATGSVLEWSGSGRKKKARLAWHREATTTY